MPEKVTIPISFFEYAGQYSRPAITALMDRARIVEAVFEALTPWKIEIDNIEPITTGKPSEQGINFRIPAKKIQFFFGADSCKFSKDDANWETANEVAEILTAASQALTNASGVLLSKQKTAIALHIQPRTKSFVDILRPFLSPAIQSLESAQVRSGASIIKWDDRRIVLDGSGALANGVFLKFEREFDGSVDLKLIAERLRADEAAILNMLDVEEDS